MEFMSLHLSGVVSFYGSSGYGFKVCVFAVSWSEIAASLIQLKGKSEGKCSKTQ